MFIQLITRIGMEEILTKGILYLLQEDTGIWNIFLSIIQKKTKPKDNRLLFRQMLEIEKG